MKILIVIFLLMTGFSLENFICKHIHNVPNAILVSDESYLNRKLYQVDGEYEFLGKSFHGAFLRTENDNTIVNVFFSLNEKMDRTFYNLMVKKYGNPNVMYKIDQVVVEKPIERDKYNSISSKGILKSCNFNENPLYISWTKANYKIEVQIAIDTVRTSISIGNENYIFNKLSRF